MVEAWCFGCCQAHQGLCFGFHLLRYSVVCTVESLYLLYLLFISWFICSRGWCIDKGLSCKPNIYVAWCTFEIRVRLAPPNRFNPYSKIFLLTVPRRYYFCGSFMLFLLCVCYAFVRVCLELPCGHLLWKGWPLGSRLWCCLIVSVLLSHLYPRSGVVLDCIDYWSLPFFRSLSGALI